MKAASLALAAALAIALGSTTLLTVSAPADADDSRATSVMQAFRQGHPCPATGSLRGKCPGYVVDHVEPLCAGSSETADGLQWQTLSQVTAKNGWDQQYCEFRRARLAFGDDPERR